jgi:hypothetical protein
LGGDVDTLVADFEMLIVEGQSNIVSTATLPSAEVITDDKQVLQKIRRTAPGIQHVKTAAAMLLRAPIGGTK